MGYFTTDRLRLALAEMIGQGQPTHHVTATLRPGRSKLVLENTLYEWFNRVNRLYVGRNWARKERQAEQMWGFVFFENGRGNDNPHAHLLLRPPMPANPLHFQTHAPFIFTGKPSSLLQKGRTPLAQGGSMWIQQISPGSESLGKLVGYDTKEMEFRPQAYEDWKFINDLSRRMALRR